MASLSSIEKKLAEYRLSRRNVMDDIKVEETTSNKAIVDISSSSRPTSLFRNYSTRLSQVVCSVTDYVHSTRVAQLVTSQSIHHPVACFIIKLTFWALLWAWFIIQGFGLVFLVLSLFYAIYATLGTKPRTDGAPSAYSVFNKNCERIDGTFTAEQLERNLIGGMFTAGIH